MINDLRLFFENCACGAWWLPLALLSSLLGLWWAWHNWASGAVASRAKTSGTATTISSDKAVAAVTGASAAKAASSLSAKESATTDSKLSSTSSAEPKPIKVEPRGGSKVSDELETDPTEEASDAGSKAESDQVATEDGDDTSEPEPNKPGVASYSALSSKYQGESVEVKAEPGLIFSSRPSCVDDLKQIKGVGEVLEKKLQAHGIYRFQQIADWNEYNVWHFNKELDFPGRIQRDEWLSQAAKLVPTSKCSGEKSSTAKAEEPKKESKDSGAVASASGSASSGVPAGFDGEDVKIDKKLGVVYNSAPKKIDDLTKISGVGAVIEKELHKFGVYRFRQIAEWTPQMIEDFTEVLEFFPGRIERDKWIDQAKKFDV